MSTPADLIRSTRHPDYIAAMTASEQAWEGYQAARSEFDAHAHTIASWAVRGQPIDDGDRARYNEARQVATSTRRAWLDDGSRLDEVRVRLGLVQMSATGAGTGVAGGRRSA